MKEVKPFGMRDKVGYMFGDFGNDFTFLLSSTILMKFYSDVMGVSIGLIGIMMMAARFLDAFTDVAVGQLVDRGGSGRDGKFLPWIRRISGPVALASFLMYASWFQDMSMGFKIFWMFFTYILWGSIFYTCINIPYGSMASAITSDPKERAQLSNWRTIGAALANTVIGVGLPLAVYYTDADGRKVLSGPRVSIAALVCSVGAVICYMLCCHMVTERVKIPQRTERFSLKALLLELAHNKPLIGIVVASICHLLAQLTLVSLTQYVYPNYFGNTLAQSVSGLVGVAVVLACAAFTVKLSQKYGRKAVGIYAALFSVVALVVTYFMHLKNAWVFVFMFALANVGIAVFTLISWAMITDVIDDAEVHTGKRSDGTIYSVYSFARKLGQAASSGLTGLLLTLIGYTVETAYDAAVVDKIYTITCLTPAAGFLALALALKFLYPLDRQRVEENARALAQKRGE